MSDLPAIILLLTFLSACAALALVVLCGLASDLRLTLRQLRTVLPHCDRAARKTCELLDQGAELLGTANRAVKHAERVAKATGDAALGIAEQVTSAHNRLRKFLGGYLGHGTNGARGGPRRHSHHGRG